MNKINGLIAALLLGIATPAIAQFCPGCIQNSSSPQTAEFNVGTGTVRGTITASTGTFTFANITHLAVSLLSGSGESITNLNASNLASGVVAAARLAGSYTGITGVGTLATGVWNGTPVGTQYGGTGQNWITQTVGRIPYFSTTGTLATLATGDAGKLLQTNGAAAPSWTGAPSVLGTNITAIPLANLQTGALPSAITVGDASLTSISAAKVSGDIAGGASFLTTPLPIGNLAGGQLPTSNPASSITVTGVAPGTYGGPTQMAQVHINSDGRIDTAAQFLLAVPPANISTGTLTGVYIPATYITTGTLIPSVVASSITGTGVAAGTYGDATRTVTAVVRSDGRLNSISQQLITLNTNQILAGALPGNVTVPAASITTGTLSDTVTATKIANSGVSAGTYGGLTQIPQLTVAADGRVTSATQFTFPALSTSTVASNVDNDWSHAQTSFSSWTFLANISAQQITGTNFNGSGAGITLINPGVISSGTLPVNVIASSIAVNAVLDASIVSVSGTKVLFGVPAANIAAGSLGSSVIASSIAVNAVTDGSIVSVSGSKVTGVLASSVPAANVTAGTFVSGVILPAAGVQAGTLGSSVVASSIAVNAVTNGSIVSMAASKLTGTVAIANGGTAATTSTGALSNLGAVAIAGSTMTGTLYGPAINVTTVTAVTYIGLPTQVCVLEPGTSESVICHGDPANTAFNTSYSVISGGRTQFIAGNNDVIGGGESNSHYLVGFNIDSTIGGGSGNSTRGSLDTISGGGSNSILGVNSGRFIGGGQGNSAGPGTQIVVGGGATNLAIQDYTTIGGGYFNIATATSSFVGGGASNFIGDAGVRAAIAGGQLNSSSGTYSFIGAGYSNGITSGSNYSSIAGGSGGSINSSALYSFLGGGLNNAVSGSYSAVVAGTSISNGGSYSFMGSGNTNSITSGANNIIIGGSLQSISGGGDQNFIGGGASNSHVGSNSSIIVGGSNNTDTSGFVNFIGGGDSNHTSSNFATIPGGRNNSATQSDTFAAGRRAKSYAQGSVTISDSQNADFVNNSTDAFKARFQGGIYFEAPYSTFSGVVTASTFNAVASAYQVDGTTVIDSGRVFYPTQIMGTAANGILNIGSKTSFPNTLTIKNNLLGINQTSPIATLSVGGSADISGNVSAGSLNTGAITASGLVTVNGGNNISQTGGGSITTDGSISAHTVNVTYGITATTMTATTFTGALVGNATTATTAASASSVPQSGVNLSTVTTALALKANLASPTFSGVVTTPSLLVTYGINTTTLSVTSSISALTLTASTATVFFVQGSGSGNALILGGNGTNIANQTDAVIVGGHNGSVTGSCDACGIFEGEFNTVGAGGGDKTVIVGGQDNTNDGEQSGIFSGTSNTIGNVNNFGGHASLLGGNGNTITGNGDNSSIIGGGGSTIDDRDNGIFISAGSSVTAGATFNAIVGGSSSNMGDGATYSVILGGQTHHITSPFAAILGGDTNTINPSANASVILGGDSHIVNGPNSAIIGGSTDVIGAGDAAIINADTSSAENQHTIVINGSNNHATADGAVIITDDTGGVTNSTANSLVVSFAGGINLASPSVQINGGTNIVYYCSGSTAGVFDGNLARGNSNTGACAGGTWVATSLKVD